VNHPIENPVSKLLPVNVGLPREIDGQGRLEGLKVLVCFCY
jgi:hypothetical protein